MNKKYEDLRLKAFSALQQLSKQNSDYGEMRMIIGAADSDASLKQRAVRKSIDTDWIARVEQALPALDVIIRDPRVAIEDQEEIVAVELTRVISEKSVKHLAQHTNLIREINGDEITPSRILNVFHEETFLTYENKFINTLLVRLAAFVDKRYRALMGGSGVEQDYSFDYGVDFEHFSQDKSRTEAKVKLHIELKAPAFPLESDTDVDINIQFAAALERIERINNAINAYLSSPFAQKLGRNYIRPPVIRTNAILKNKDFKDCLSLWEFIEGYDKTGYSIHGEEFAEKPSDQYVTDFYAMMALQYTQFYHGVVEQDVDILAKRKMPELDPDFNRDLNEEEQDDYQVYDSEYKKMVPVSRLMDNRKKLSEDERRIREAVEIALHADEILNADLLRKEEEERRLERERIAAEKERLARLAAMEEAARRGPVTFRYKRSYLSRYIQSDDQLKANYNVIKNELLSYCRVISRISWKCEAFRQGKNAVARINVKGKKLYLYLALSPKEYEGSTYASDAAGKYSDTPLLVKIRSARSLKYALSLLVVMMEKLGIGLTDHVFEDYIVPYESTEQLVERGLIKLILPPGITVNEFDQMVREDMSSVFGAVKNVTADKQETDSAEILAVQDNECDLDTVLQINGRYRRSYLSRYIQAGDFLQANYTAIKNELLSYKRINSRVSWKCETFWRGRANIARINVKGKSLYLYLALPFADYEATPYVNSAESKYSDTSLLIKIKSTRSLKRALALIAEMMQKLKAVRVEREPEDYSMPYQTTEELVSRGLVKTITPAESAQENSENAEVFENIEDTEADVIFANQENTVENIDAPNGQDVSESEESVKVTADTENSYAVPTREGQLPLAIDAEEEVSQGGVIIDPSERVVVDISSIDCSDADFSHEVTIPMIEKLGITKQIILTEKRIYITHTHYMLSIVSIPKENIKRMRLIEKNFDFKDDGMGDGIAVPFTRQEYGKLSLREKKKFMAHLSHSRECDILQMQLSALKILKSDDKRIIDKIKKLEARLQAQEKDMADKIL